MGSLGNLSERVVEEGKAGACAKTLRFFLFEKRIEVVRVKHEGNVDRGQRKVGEIETGRGFPLGVIVGLIETLDMLAQGIGVEDAGAPEFEAVGGAVEKDAPATFSKELLTELGGGLISFLLSWSMARLGAEVCKWLCDGSIGGRRSIDTRLVNVDGILMARGVVKVLGAIVDDLTKAVKEVEKLEMILEMVKLTDGLGCVGETDLDAIVERLVELFALVWR